MCEHKKNLRFLLIFLSSFYFFFMIFLTSRIIPSGVQRERSAKSSALYIFHLVYTSQSLYTCHPIAPILYSLTATEVSTFLVVKNCQPYLSISCIFKMPFYFASLADHSWDISVLSSEGLKFIRPDVMFKFIRSLLILRYMSILVIGDPEIIHILVLSMFILRPA